jgi:hypothetical protein
MKPLDLREDLPRGPRETMLGFMFLPRTIDKICAELPGGHLGPFLNHDTGFSAYVVRRLGLQMDDLRAAIAESGDEPALLEWLHTRIDLSMAPLLNAKLETFVIERMSADDLALVRQRHPVLATHPDLSKILDVLEADDAALAVERRRSGQASG